jgi:hypothetical protein
MNTHPRKETRKRGIGEVVTMYYSLVMIIVNRENLRGFGGIERSGG